MTSRFMIMAPFKDSTVEGVISGNINMALVGEDVGHNLPVSKAGVEQGRNVFIHRLECLQDKGVTGRSRLDVLG